MSEKITVTLQTGDVKEQHTLRKGLTLQALRETKLLEFDCRKADCGICLVELLSGAEHVGPKTPAEQDFLKAMHAGPRERLGCQLRCFGDVVLDVPEP